VYRGGEEREHEVRETPAPVGRVEKRGDDGAAAGQQRAPFFQPGSQLGGGCSHAGEPQLPQRRVGGGAGLVHGDVGKDVAGGEPRQFCGLPLELHTGVVHLAPAR
jgi:hypothetical protein